MGKRRNARLRRFSELKEKKKRLGREFRAAREKEGRSQESVAELLDTSTATISRMETGQASVVLLIFIILFLSFLSKGATFTQAARKITKLRPLAGRKLRERREAINLSQAELAEELGVSRSTINRWEQGYFDSTLMSYKWLTLALDEIGQRRALEKQKAA
jgi:transcriptional regulator with XRE-family HTH domain